MKAGQYVEEEEGDKRGEERKKRCGSEGRAEKRARRGERGMMRRGKKAATCTAPLPPNFLNTSPQYPLIFV